MSHPTSLIGKVVYDPWVGSPMLQFRRCVGTGKLHDDLTPLKRPGLWARSHLGRNMEKPTLRRCGAKRCECSRGHYQDQAKLVEENTFFFYGE